MDGHAAFRCPRARWFGACFAGRVPRVGADFHRDQVGGSVVLGVGIALFRYGFQQVKEYGPGGFGTDQGGTRRPVKIS